MADRPRPHARSALVAAAIALAASVIAASPPHPAIAAEALRQVPNVVGIQGAEAVHDLEQVGRTALPATPLQDLPPGYVVVSQNPAAGVVTAWNGRVALVFGPGPDANPQTAPTQTAPTKKTAASDDPTANAVGGSIALPRTVTTPNLVGLTPAQAARRLRQVGLNLDGLFGPEPFSAEGRIVETTPVADTRVSKGSGVAIRLASATFTIPGVLGLPSRTAVADLTRANLAVSLSPFAPPDGIVVQQTPPPYADGRPGETVTLTVAGLPWALIGAITAGVVLVLTVSVAVLVARALAARRRRLIASLRVEPSLPRVTSRLASGHVAHDGAVGLSWEVTVSTPRLAGRPGAPL